MSPDPLFSPGITLGMPLVLFPEEIVLLFFGEDWLGVAPIMRVMSISFVIRFCTGYADDNLVMLRGRTRFMLKWGIINTVLVLTLGSFMIKFISSPERKIRCIRPSIPL